MKYLTLLGVTYRGVISKIAILKLPISISRLCYVVDKIYRSNFDAMVLCFSERLADAVKPEVPSSKKIFDADFGFIEDNVAAFVLYKVPETVPFCYQEFAVLGKKYQMLTEKAYASFAVNSDEKLISLCKNGVFFYSRWMFELQSYASKEILQQYLFDSGSKLQEMLLQVRREVCNKEESHFSQHKYQYEYPSADVTLEEIYTEYKENRFILKTGQLEVVCSRIGRDLNFPIRRAGNIVKIYPGCVEYSNIYIKMFDQNINLSLDLLREEILRIEDCKCKTVIFEDWNKLKDLTLMKLVRLYA